FSGSVLISALVISAIAITAKIAGCGLPLVAQGRRTALQVGVGMTPRGEVGLIVSLVGLQMKMISDAGYAMVAFMTVVTLLLAPPPLRIVLHQERNAPPGLQSRVESEAESAPLPLE